MASGTTRSVVTRPPTYQAIIGALQSFWEKQGCVVMQPYHTEVGAGTFNPATFLRCLDARPWRAAYVEPSTRPADGRYGENPFRLGHYFQYQVVIKPSPPDIQDLYLQSLQALGVDLRRHDVRFVEDNWEGPTLGAWGQGWEVWADGMEITQFTYFQQLGGFDCDPVTIELTYGLERIAMYLQGVDSVFDIVWSRWTEPDGAEQVVTYGDVYRENEREFSRYNFEVSDADMLFRHFTEFEAEAQRCLDARLPIPAYDYVLKCSHAFNMLDARGVISVTDRTAHIASVRDLARKVAGLYLEVTAERDDAGGADRNDVNRTDDKRGSISGRREGRRHFVTAGWLFEIGVEELPYRTCLSLLAQLRGAGTAEAPGLVYEALAAERLIGRAGATDPVAFAETRLKVMVAPRRVAVWVRDVPREQTAQTLRHRGPRADVAFGPDGTPTKAGEGFARGKGLTPATLQRETVDGTEFVVAVIEAERRPAERVLPDICRRLITSLQIPRGMRWGARPAGADDYLRFSRPLRWLVCIFAGQPVPFDFYDLRAGAVTQGHRVLGRPLIVDHASHYERHLREQHVIADHDERRRLIVEGLDAAAAKLGGSRKGVRWSDPAGVLEENIYLAEWPSVHSGAFDERHLRLPSEVLITAMQAHQRYWPVERHAAACCRRSSTSPTPTRPPPRSSRTATSACSKAASTTPSSPTTATSPRASRPWPRGWARSSFTPSWARSPTSRRAWWPSRVAGRRGRGREEAAPLRRPPTPPPSPRPPTRA